MRKSQSEYQNNFQKKHPGLKAKWNRDWIAKNRERYNASKYRYRDKVKLEAMLFYGKGKVVCANCGFDNIDALCLDHINNDGAEHRKALKISGRSSLGGNTYERLKKLGYPPGLQVLCANCNLMKEIQRKKDKRLTNKWYLPLPKGGGAVCQK